MKRGFGEVLIDVVIALGLGLAIWLSGRGGPRLIETRGRFFANGEHPTVGH
jgi:hypothetical protein